MRFLTILLLLIFSSNIYATQPSHIIQQTTEYSRLYQHWFEGDHYSSNFQTNISALGLSTYQREYEDFQPLNSLHADQLLINPSFKLTENAFADLKSQVEALERLNWIEDFKFSNSERTKFAEDKLKIAVSLYHQIIVSKRLDPTLDLAYMGLARELFNRAAKPERLFLATEKPVGLLYQFHLAHFFNHSLDDTLKLANDATTAANFLTICEFQSSHTCLYQKGLYVFAANTFALAAKAPRENRLSFGFDQNTNHLIAINRGVLLSKKLELNKLTKYLLKKKLELAKEGWISEVSEDSVKNEIINFTLEYQKGLDLKSKAALQLEYLRNKIPYYLILFLIIYGITYKVLADHFADPYLQSESRTLLSLFKKFISTTDSRLTPYERYLLIIAPIFITLTIGELKESIKEILKVYNY